jgi:predicted DNA-binding WGR domain protein
MHLDSDRQLTTFLNIAYIIQRAIRGKGPLPFSSEIEMARKWGRVERRGTKMNAENLKFFPRDEELDEDEFENKIGEGKAGWYLALLRHHGNNYEGLLAFIRSCYETSM